MASAARAQAGRGDDRRAWAGALGLGGGRTEARSAAAGRGRGARRRSIEPLTVEGQGLEALPHRPPGDTTPASMAPASRRRADSRSDATPPPSLPLSHSPTASGLEASPRRVTLLQASKAPGAVPAAGRHCFAPLPPNLELRTIELEGRSDGNSSAWPVANPALTCASAMARRRPGTPATSSPTRSSMCRSAAALLGAGRFKSYPAARIQLALAALLRRDLLPDASSPADLFDPVLSAAALGFAVPSLNDGCRRRAGEPTLFYMPHCEASLYDALLAANWESPAQLRQLCVLGNSFWRYALQAEKNGSGPAAKAKHVLAAEVFAQEERIDEAADMEEDDVFARAFNETSWHFFEVDDDFDLAAAISAASARRR